MMASPDRSNHEGSGRMEIGGALNREGELARGGKRRVRRFAILLPLFGLLLLGAGVRVRTQTGWRVVSTDGMELVKQGGDTALRLTLVDLRDRKRHEYHWDFARVGKEHAGVEVDCGEFKRVLIWKTDSGLAFDGQRFRRKIAPGERGFGIDGVYRYDFGWFAPATALTLGRSR